GTRSKLAQAKGCRNKEDEDRMQKLKDRAIELKVEKDVEFYKNLMYRWVSNHFSFFSSGGTPSEELQCVELKKKQDAQSQLLRQKQKSDKAAKQLQDEIHRIKTQKVQLQHKIKQELEQFRLWKASREKEVRQLTIVVCS
ncbi:hypothetical protein IFM89_031700, partial [Coptis chinensis]